jgi:hypothetical protein
VNLSSSGVLFVGRALPAPNDLVELSWVEAPTKYRSTSVVGTTGRVVRIDPTLPGAVAVEFTHPEHRFTTE